MVLADGKELQSELVGEFRLLQEIAHPLPGADAGMQVGKGDESEVHQR